MCGLSALIGAQTVASPRWIVAMTRAVSHRGPDDEGFATFSGSDLQPRRHRGEVGQGPVVPAGFAAVAAGGVGHDWADVRVALGHRRLSIVGIDATGHQPMCSADGLLWIVFNGEIYNYPELRQELSALGHGFFTNGDTEVILAAYRQWGTDCLRRFNGMFSFLLLDRARNAIFAARDRFGVKPLYYWVASDGTIAFASEIKQFTTLPGWKARVNGQRAYDFLVWGLIDNTDQTLFDGVFQVAGGHFILLDLDGARDRRGATPGARLASQRWYHLQPIDFAGDFAAAAESFARLLESSVSLRLRADVKVGSCLSGGLDSSSIVSVMDRLLKASGTHPHTFTAAARERRFDESSFVNMVLAATGASGQFVYPEGQSLFEVLDRLVWHQDEPFGSTSIYAQWHVFSLAARNGVKVMLDGQGADEQLAGYHSFFSPRLATLLCQGDLGGYFAEARALSRVHGYSAAWILARTVDGTLPASVRQPLRWLAGKPSTAGAAHLNLDRLRATPADPFAAATDPRRGRTMGALSRAQLLSTSVPMLLHFEDRNSMAHAVEARVPFLDYRLVEFSLGLPDEFKLHLGTTKRVLREAMCGSLPEAVRTRTDKMGFVTPEETWLRTEMPDRFADSLRRSIEDARGLIMPSAMSALSRIVSGEKPFSFMPWRQICFGAWMRVFDVAVD